MPCTPAQTDADRQLAECSAPPHLLHPELACRRPWQSALVHGPHAALQDRSPTHLMLLANCACDSWRSSALRASVALSIRSSRRPSGLRPARAAPRSPFGTPARPHARQPSGPECEVAPAWRTLRTHSSPLCASSLPFPQPPSLLTLRQALLLHLLLQLVPLERRALVAQLHKAQRQLLQAQQRAQHRHLRATSRRLRGPGQEGQRAGQACRLAGGRAGARTPGREPVCPACSQLAWKIPEGRA